MLYIDNTASFSPSSNAINDEITSLKKAFNLTDEGDLKGYLGTHFIHHSDGQIKLKQQKPINNCLNLLGLGSETQNGRLHDTPAETSKILHPDPSGPEQIQSWNYCAVIGCLNYIQVMTSSDLSYAVNQCAHSPKLSHEQALKRICQYLKATCQYVLFFTPTFLKVFNVLWMQIGQVIGSNRHGQSTFKNWFLNYLSKLP